MYCIKIRLEEFTNKSSEEIILNILDTDKWNTFKGFLIIPSIKEASYKEKKDNIIGSKIKVISTDNSTHTEEIIEFEKYNKISLKFCDFESPLKNLANYFIETFNFEKENNKTKIIRNMEIYPKNSIGYIILKIISIFMKKALKIHLYDISK